jgi:hypothetical protein
MKNESHTSRSVFKHSSTLDARSMQAIATVKTSNRLRDFLYLKLSCDFKFCAISLLKDTCNKIYAEYLVPSASQPAEDVVIYPILEQAHSQRPYADALPQN